MKVIDIDDQLKLAMLDKEVAEEKSEALDEELSEWKERVEELGIEIEILKEERSLVHDNTPDSHPSRNSKTLGNSDLGLEIAQLSKQNERLKEALIKYVSPPQKSFKVLLYTLVDFETYRQRQKKTSRPESTISRNTPKTLKNFGPATIHSNPD